jgi:hypothetical protein
MRAEAVLTNACSARLGAMASPTFRSTSGPRGRRFRIDIARSSRSGDRIRVWVCDSRMCLRSRQVAAVAPMGRVSLSQRSASRARAKRGGIPAGGGSAAVHERAGKNPPLRDKTGAADISRHVSVGTVAANAQRRDGSAPNSRRGIGSGVNKSRVLPNEPIVRTHCEPTKSARTMPCPAPPNHWAKIFGTRNPGGDRAADDPHSGHREFAPLTKWGKIAIVTKPTGAVVGWHCG